MFSCLFGYPVWYDYVRSFRIHTPSLAHGVSDARPHPRGGAPRPSGRRPPRLHAPGTRAARVSRV
eukprot:6174053-Pleurochrysis_carterae.AAC.1